MPATEYVVSDGVATITLSNPPQNRMTPELVSGLMEAIQDLSTHSDVRVLLLKSSLTDFSYGGDIAQWPRQSVEQFNEAIQQAVQLVNAFQDLPFPIVVAVNGYCGGGAFEITLRGDIIVAADNAKFCHSEPSIGVFTFLGGVQRVAERVGRTRAMQWALTGEQVDAETAYRTGLVNEVVPLADLEESALAWVDTFKNGATRAHNAHKQLLRAWSEGGIGSADTLLSQIAGEILHTEDAQGCLPDAIKAVTEGRARPRFEFKGR